MKQVENSRLYKVNVLILQLDCSHLYHCNSKHLRYRVCPTIQAHSPKDNGWMTMTKVKRNKSHHENTILGDGPQIRQFRTRPLRLMRPRPVSKWYLQSSDLESAGSGAVYQLHLRQQSGVVTHPTFQTKIYNELLKTFLITLLNDNNLHSSGKSKIKHISNFIVFKASPISTTKVLVLPFSWFQMLNQ